MMQNESSYTALMQNLAARMAAEGLITPDEKAHLLREISRMGEQR